ncbi:cathepsin B-like [Tetranychus urticae]|uniref:Peptidase C1A papain C-terminal domain-containing protein n=1 Tax=Tetranychus urticae TaxID=32264 RepID=T1KCV2_TETUR|nr:cathepsin B-like [Tetranychus urticae]
MRFFIFIVLFTCSCKAYQTSSETDTSSDTDIFSDEIIDLINALNITWKAGKNLHGLSLSKMKKLFMSSEETLTSIREKLRYLRHDEEQISSFDSRDKWAHCPSIGQIYDQGLCSPSWIYASVGQIADRLCVNEGNKTNIDVDTTVKNMMRSNYGCSNEFNSADMAKAFEYWETTNIAISDLKKCLPFSKRCDIYSDRNFYGIRRVTYYRPVNESGIQYEILHYGPITSHIDVYLDLLFYKSGVYQRRSNVKLGSHVVKCIGWGSENGVDYWLLANSWGTKWGENGFFKLKRGTNELGMEKNNLAVSLNEIDERVEWTLDRIFVRTP